MNTAAAEPTHFDDLWDFNNPKATEEKFRTLLVTVSKSENQEYLLQLKTQIARTQGLQRNFELAHKTLDEVESKLSERTPVAQIRYLLERGRVFNSSKERTQAKPLFEKSFQLAKKALEDNFAVDAAHMMAIVESNPQKQMEWNKIALAIAENSKEERARKWLGSLYNNMGWTYHDSGNYSEALDLFEKALEFRKSKGEPTSIRIAEWCVARTLRSLQKYDQALKIQLKLEMEIRGLPQKDGYVYEELGELYLVLKDSKLSKKNFLIAFDLLSKDEWFKANESKRLERIKKLSDN